jgi:FkbM family methyltransferase
MKFVFVETLPLPRWNGTESRITRGVSGTHAAIINLAEALVMQNHSCIVVSTTNNIKEDICNGVHYLNIEHFEEQSCDYVIATNYINEMVILNKITNYKKVIFILHNELANLVLSYEYSPFTNIPRNKVLLAYISENSKMNILKMQPFLGDYDNMLLYNSISDNDIHPFHREEKLNHIVFFACIERGLKYTMDIVRQLPNFKLITKTYDEFTWQQFEPTEQTVILQESSKNAVMRELCKAKYFIYPLLNKDYHIIHYDTFGYVILEALMHGVVVIVPRMAVYYELFGDALCYIDSEGIIDPNDFVYWERGHQKLNFGYIVFQKYLDRINELENNVDLRNEFINKGLKLREKFLNTNISKLLCEKLEVLDKKQYDLHVQNHLRNLHNINPLPENHFNYLVKLKNEGFEPKVIYDIGSCVLHWTNQAKKIWPDAKYILFDAFAPAEFLYKEYGYDYYIGVLSNNDDTIVKFYQNDSHPGGNSYYREIGFDNGAYFPKDKYIEMKTVTLDSIVNKLGFPAPDFIKIDVQGAEIDIIRGGVNTIKNASKMVVELQHMQYNEGALLCEESIKIIEELGWKCVAPLFQNNGADGDYGFENMNITKS